MRSQLTPYRQNDEADIRVGRLLGVCSACVEAGGTWVHLGSCPNCGPAGGCDRGPNRDARLPSVRRAAR